MVLTEEREKDTKLVRKMDQSEHDNHQSFAVSLIP